MTRYLSVHGTIGRSEWCLLYCLPVVLVCIPLLLIVKRTGNEDLRFLSFLANVFFWLALPSGAAKRARAMGYNPWLALGTLLPVFGFFVAVYFGVGADVPEKAGVAEPLS